MQISFVFPTDLMWGDGETGEPVEFLAAQERLDSLCKGTIFIGASNINMDDKIAHEYSLYMDATIFWRSVCMLSAERSYLPSPLAPVTLDDGLKKLQEWDKTILGNMDEPKTVIYMTTPLSAEHEQQYLFANPTRTASEVINQLCDLLERCRLSENADNGSKIGGEVAEVFEPSPFRGALEALGKGWTPDNLLGPEASQPAVVDYGKMDIDDENTLSESESESESGGVVIQI